MRKFRHLCIYNSVAGNPVAESFRSLRGCTVLGEVRTWKELEFWLREGSVDLVVVDLEDPESLEILEQVCNRYSSCKVVGIGRPADSRRLIQANRLGCNEFVTKPIRTEDLQEAVERILGPQTTVPVAHKKICIVGASGGVGTTTIACNLSIELANLTHCRCGLIDMNLELGDIGSVLNLTPEYSLADVCSLEKNSDHRLLEKAFQPLPYNVFVLHAPSDTKSLDSITPEGIKTVLALARETFPFIVIDLPRTFDPLVAAAAEGADHFLIVTELAVAGIHNAARIQVQFSQMGVSKKSIGVVVNRNRSRHGSVDRRIVKEHFGDALFGVVPNDYARAKMALDLGEPLGADKRSSPIRVALREMAAKIAADQFAEEVAHSRAEDRGNRKPARDSDSGASAADADSHGFAGQFVSAARRLTSWPGKRQCNSAGGKENYAELNDRHIMAEARLRELQERIGALSSESAERSGQIERLGGELEAAHRELAERQQSCCDLDSQLAALTADRDAALNERVRSQAELQSIQAKLQHLNDQKEEWRREREAQQEHIGIVQEQRDAVQRDLDRSAAHNASLEERLQESATRISELQNQIGTLSGESAERAGQIERFGGELEAAHRDLAERQQSCCDLEGQLAALTADRDTALSEQLRSEAELHTALEQVQRLQHGLNTQSQNNRSLDEQLQEKAARIGELEGRIEALSRESGERAGQIERLGGQLEAAHRELAERQRSCCDLENQLAALTADRDAALSEQLRSEAELQTALEQVQQLQDQETRRKQIDALRSELHSSLTNDAILQERLQQTQSRVIEVGQEFAQVGKQPPQSNAETGAVLVPADRRVGRKRLATVRYLQHFAVVKAGMLAAMLRGRFRLLIRSSSSLRRHFHRIRQAAGARLPSLRRDHGRSEVMEARPATQSSVTQAQPLGGFRRYQRTYRRLVTDSPLIHRRAWASVAAFPINGSRRLLALVRAGRRLVQRLPLLLCDVKAFFAPLNPPENDGEKTGREPGELQGQSEALMREVEHLARQIAELTLCPEDSRQELVDKQQHCRDLQARLASVNPNRNAGVNEPLDTSEAIQAIRAQIQEIQSEILEAQKQDARGKIDSRSPDRQQQHAENAAR